MDTDYNDTVTEDEVIDRAPRTRRVKSYAHRAAEEGQISNYVGQPMKVHTESDSCDSQFEHPNNSIVQEVR